MPLYYLPLSLHVRSAAAHAAERDAVHLGHATNRGPPVVRAQGVAVVRDASLMSPSALTCRFGRTGSTRSARTRPS